MSISTGWGPTYTSDSDDHGIGTVKDEKGKRYRWVKLVDQDGAAGEVVYSASTSQWDVTTDYTGGSGVTAMVKGVLLTTVDISVAAYCWVQIEGIVALRTDAGVAAGEALIGHTVDGEADTMAAGEENLVFGYALETDGTTAVSGQDSCMAVVHCG